LSLFTYEADWSTLLDLHHILEPWIEAMQLAFQGTAVRGRIFIAVVNEVVCHILAIGSWILGSSRYFGNECQPLAHLQQDEQAPAMYSSRICCSQHLTCYKMIKIMHVIAFGMTNEAHGRKLAPAQGEVYSIS
jgi:hypothetical protein